MARPSPSMYNEIAMIGTFVLAACLSSAPQDPLAGFSIDVFLVANNQSVLQGLDWIDHPQPGDSIQRLLRPTLESYRRAKSPFIIVDGGDCSLFPAQESPGLVAIRAQT